MRPLVFVDLDDTLLQTLPKCPPGAVLHAVATGRDGKPLSFMTDRQRALFDWLDAIATLIPTTARDLSAFRRVSLPFRHAAVLNFGGTVLDPGGAPNSAWADRTEAAIAPLAGALESLRSGIVAFCQAGGIDAHARVLGDFGMALYVVVKHRTSDLVEMERLHQHHVAGLQDERFVVYRNGNNLSIVPRSISKDRAVRFLIETYAGDAITIGLGDSRSDAAFLATCDFGMIPRGSQLFEALVPPTA